MEKAEPNEASPQAESAVVGTGNIGISIDALSKWLAVGLLFVYISGFLITSLNDFRFGFSEMNPLRPRILAAGGWFILFLAIPFALVREWTKHSLWKQQLSRYHKAALLLYTFYVSGNFIAFAAQGIFVLDQSGGGKLPSLPPAWVVIVIVIGLIVFIGVIVRFYSRLPRWVVAAAIFGLIGYIVWQGVDSIFVKKTLEYNATGFWILAVGMIEFSEMRSRSWRPVLGDWPRTLVMILGTMAVFSTAYYPHIVSKWGGGAPIPIQLTLSKDAPDLGYQRVNCELIDETDDGIYVIGKGEKHATFIPRAEIALIHFSDENEKSIFTPKSDANSH